MRKIACLFFGIVGAACLAAAPMCLSTPAVAEEKANVSNDHFDDEIWWGKAEDITFGQYDLYTMENAFDEMPKTFETWLQLNESRVSVGGTIFGNIDAGVHVAGSYPARTTTNAISLEIDTKGRPKLYHRTDDGEVQIVVFNADVRSEEFVHLAVTRDEDTAYCYLNGELVDSAELIVEDFVSDYPFAIANDYRESRSNYFRGKLHSFAAYSDTRTQAEILADMKAADVTDEALMVSYNLEGKKGVKFIKDQSANANRLEKGWLFADSIDEAAYDYSMMVLGDTQALTYYRQGQAGVNSFDKLFDYIVANANNQKVKHVAHLGDITQKSGTDNKAPDEFNYAKANYAKLDAAGIPYSVLAGNHDFSSGKATNYISVFGGTENAYAKQYFASANPTTALTTAHTFSAGELDYLVVAISFNATAADIAWADEIIAAHPYHNVIITTHGYVNQKGGETSLSSYIEEGDYNWVQALDKVVRKHENVVLTLNGHHPTTAIESFTITGDHGNKITKLLIDPTYFDGEHASATVPHFPEGAGMIANLRFSDNGRKIGVSWFSAIKGKYYNSESVYTVEVPTIARRQAGEEDTVKVDVKVEGEGGQASASVTEFAGTPFSVTVTPSKGYYLSKLTVGGADVTSGVVNNVYTVQEVSQTKGTLAIVAEFAPFRYPVNVENASDKGVIAWKTEETQFIAGTQLSFTVTPKSGWKVTAVTFNGETVNADTDGLFVVQTTDTANDIRVEYAEVKVPSITVTVPNEQDKPTQDPDTENTPPSELPNDTEDTEQDEAPATDSERKKEGGALGAALLGGGIGFALSLAAGIAAVVIIEKRKRQN